MDLLSRCDVVMEVRVTLPAGYISVCVCVCVLVFARRCWRLNICPDAVTQT